MATAAELQIIISAQDSASAHLRRLGGEVARLEQQVSRAGGGRGGLLGGLQLGAGFAAAQQAFAGLQGVVGFVAESVVGLNSRLEQSRAAFEALTGSAGAARELLRITREEAAKGFDVRQMEEAGRTLVTSAQGSKEAFRELLQLSEQLAVVDPAAGIASGAFAIREALSGDFTSLVERFEVSRVAIARWRAEGVSNLEIVRRAVESVGGSAAAVDRLGRTFEARRTVIANFADELRGLVGAGLFDRLNDLLARGVALIDEYGDRLRDLAGAVGAALAGIAQTIASALTGPLKALTDMFAPGLWDQLVASMARAPEVLEETAAAAERAAPAVEDVTRTLARLGVEGGRLSLDVDRVRRGYEDQLAPLERQLRLLEQSGDLQRIQAGLATNRGAVEGLRLEREIAALRRAAGGATDPNAEGLTLRQRMIALALEERELQQEQLGIEGQRRPQILSLQQQIARIQEEQRKALEPLERSLALRRDEVAALQLTRQEAELATQAAEAGAERVRKAWTATNSPEALADAKKRGEELAAEWKKGWDAWIEAGGGTFWGAMGKSLDDWWTKYGRPRALAVGAELGATMGLAAGEALQRWLHQDPVLDALIRTVRVATGNPVPQVTAEVQRRSFDPATGQTSVVNISPGAVTVNGVPDAERTERLRQTVLATLDAFAQAAANTEPGASPRLAGAGRAP